MRALVFFSISLSLSHSHSHSSVCVHVCVCVVLSFGPFMNLIPTLTFIIFSLELERIRRIVNERTRANSSELERT